MGLWYRFCSAQHSLDNRAGTLLKSSKFYSCHQWEYKFFDRWSTTEWSIVDRLHCSMFDNPCFPRHWDPWGHIWPEHQAHSLHNIVNRFPLVCWNFDTGVTLRSKFPINWSSSFGNILRRCCPPRSCTRSNCSGSSSTLSCSDLGAITTPCLSEHRPRQARQGLKGRIYSFNLLKQSHWKFN